MATGLAAIKHEKIGVARLKTLDKNSKSSERRGNNLKDAPTLKIKGSGYNREEGSMDPRIFNREAVAWTSDGTRREGSDRANG